MTSPWCPYPYEHLEHRQIRLLELLPGRENDDITCKLHHASLDSNTFAYEALSYTWGARESPKSIVILGKHVRDRKADENTNPRIFKRHTIHITENLLVALQSLRHTDASRTLWIDALCISQSDPPERSTQVSLMRTIYQSAARTIVFLGPDDPLRAHATSLIHRLAALDPAALDSDSPIPGLDYFTSHPAKFCFQHPEDHGAFAHFLARPWWSRVWVIQEVAVARAAVVVWGGESFEWEVCGRAVHAARHYSDFVRPEEERFWASGVEQYRAHAVIWARLRFWQEREVSLFSLLKEFWNHEATDPRDKVFGVLGLVVGDYVGAVEPDYLKSWEAVYCDVVADIILQEGNMDALSYCSGVGARRREGLPTWAPDWTSESCRKSLVMMKLEEARDPIGGDTG